MTQYKDLIESATYARRQWVRFRHDVRKRSTLGVGRLFVPSANRFPSAEIFFDKSCSTTIEYHTPKVMSETTILHLRESLSDKIRLYRKFIEGDDTDIELASKFVANTQLTVDDAHLLHRIIVDNGSDNASVLKALDDNMIMSKGAFDFLHSCGYRMTVMEHRHGCATGNIKRRLQDAIFRLPELTEWPSHFTNRRTVKSYAEFSITSLPVLMRGAAVAGMHINELLTHRYLRNIESTPTEFIETFAQVYCKTPYSSIKSTKTLDVRTCDAIHAMLIEDHSKYTWMPLEAPREWWDAIDDKSLEGYRMFSNDCAYDHVSGELPISSMFMMYRSLYYSRCRLVADAVAVDWRDRAFIPGGREYHLTLMHLAD